MLSTPGGFEELPAMLVKGAGNCKGWAALTAYSGVLTQPLPTGLPMKDGDQIPQEQAPILRSIDIIGATYQSAQGEVAGAMLTLLAGSLTAPTRHRFVVSLESLQKMASLLTQAAQQGIARTTPAPGRKH